MVRLAGQLPAGADMADKRVWAGTAVATAIAFFGSGCDPNSKPIYGEESGLPKNCRAIVQANIDWYRSGMYTADEVMSSLERNCGANGHSWGY